MNRMAELIKQKDKMIQEILELNREFVKKEPDIVGCPSKNFIQAVEKKNMELDQVLLSIFKEQDECAGSAHFSRKNTWCWGGPTPKWGGSMDMDTSVKGAEYFGFDNVVYLHGPVNEDAIKLHSKCKKILCALSGIGRTAGAQPESDTETAENLSKLSLKYKNIKGGIIDDLIQSYGRNYSCRDIESIYNALKKHNSELDLYAVVYAHELDLPSVKAFEPFIDCVNLWFWLRSDLADMDLTVEKCRHVFPGKKIMMGVFMHDYGLGAIGNTAKIIESQLKKARQLLAAGKINDIVILGDREIVKYPDTAKSIKEFFASEFRQDINKHVE